jgi:phage/plasmid-like protein (TIGR03299 family)
MSHNIDETVTGGAFAAVRQPAWHGLGVTIDQPVKALELLRLANADFPILRGAVRLDETVPLDDSGAFTVRYEAVDSRNTLIYRIHPETGEAQILGVASKGYPLLTPAQTLIGFGDAIMGPGHMRSATAGVLDEGRQVFMSFELPEDLCLGGGDPARLYLTVSTSCDQSTASAARISAVRVVCANTLEAARQSAKREIVFRKTARLDIQALQAKSALELVPEYVAQLKAEAEELLAVKVTNAKFLEIISDLWAPEENAGKAKVTRWESHRDHLRHLFEAAPTQEFGRGTGWAAVNAVTEDRDWFSQVKGADSDEQRDATRFSRSIGLTKSTGITEPKLAIAQRVLALV